MKMSFAIGLRGRIIAILVIGLTLSHILSILVFTSEKLEPALLTDEQQVLAQMVTAIRMMLVIPDGEQHSILSALNRNGLHLKITRYGPGDGEPPPHQNDERLRRHLETALGSTGVRVVALFADPPDWNHHHGKFHHFLFDLEMVIIRLMHDTVMEKELHAWIDLPTGRRILLQTQLTENHVPLFRHATLSVIIMTGAIVLFAIAIARSMTTPLQRIVAAANAIGEDVYAVQLPEKGTVEVVAVARAFNRMNRRIQTFVEDRLQMVAAISHDLRTPLTKLKLMAEFVGDETSRVRMVATLDEMESMLAATLSFARDATTLEPKQSVNLSGLIGAICADMSDAGHTVFFEEMDRVVYPCRPLTMKRALINLIENAVKYGGSAQVSLLCEEQRFVVLIQDPGPGIPEDQWDNVFKPFFRLDPSRSHDTGGVGLGLSIAASVIRDHDGLIRFAHLREGGFMTRIELPVGH
ncbi:MAG: HAMP domain-containing protein [Magnetococcales bacterium]|nr:HAMP domain-containing protein [Magnetococcales bacterium]